MLLSSFREGHVAIVPVHTPSLNYPIATRTHSDPREKIFGLLARGGSRS